MARLRRVGKRFQSTPAIADGRTGTACAGILRRAEFQFTPAIADGRTAHGDPDYLLANGFNPRPPSLTGEPEERGMQIVGDVVFQSTPAIADGRTVFALSAKGQKQCFNPRPPSLTGEPFELLMRACAAEVSIHARHR